MRIIFVILLSLVLGCKGPTMAANTEQDDLLQSCKSYEKFCTDNNMLLRNHIEFLTNSMEEMTINSCGQLYDQVQKNLKKENELREEIARKNEHIRRLEENMNKYQMENINYKSRETVLLDNLKQSKEQLQASKNICERKEKEFKARETELQRELQSKNVEIRHLGENMETYKMENKDYKSRETVILDLLEQNEKQLEVSKNVIESERKLFMAKETQLQREVQKKNDQMRQLHNSKTAVQEELKKQQVINEQLVKNQCELENTEIAQIKAKLSSEGEKLVKCNTELESKRNALVEIDKEKTKEQTELKKSADKLEKRNRASCITQDSSGVHTVTLSNNDTFEVLCNSDIAGPGWTVIYQRFNGKVNFERNWNTYRNGFGDSWDGEFFLGLEKIHRLTTELPHELYIHMEGLDGRTYYAMYDEFAISGEDDKYRLNNLGRISDNKVDELRLHIMNDYFPTSASYSSSKFMSEYISPRKVTMMIRPKPA